MTMSRAAQAAADLGESMRDLTKAIADLAAPAKMDADEKSLSEALEEELEEELEQKLRQSQAEKQMLQYGVLPFSGAIGASLDISV